MFRENKDAFSAIVLNDRERDLFPVEGILVGAFRVILTVRRASSFFILNRESAAVHTIESILGLDRVGLQPSTETPIL